MSLKAIVFDFDGVIADSEPLHFRAFRDVLAGEGVELTERDYRERYLGFSDTGAFQEIAADRAIAWRADELAALASRKAARFEEIERDGTALFPGAEAAIRRTAAAVPIAIASGALREEIVRVLDRAGLTRVFSAIVAAGETAASKPAPDPYQRAVALLAAAGNAPLDPAHCVAIEDSRWGLASARAAGLRTVAIGRHDDVALLADADLVIDDLSALSVSVLRHLCGPDST